MSSKHSVRPPFSRTTRERISDMEKSTRRAKTTGDVSLLQVSPSYIGVRTRAKTLALQRLRSDASSLPSSCYLELRSRRLEKTLMLQNARKIRQGCACGESKAREDEEGSILGLKPVPIEAEDLGIQDSFDENDSVSRLRGRNNRESTPCNLIRAAGTISPPVSTKKQTSPSGAANQRALLQQVPSLPEWEKHFELEEQSQQRLFTEKYNFDIVNEKPLPGRYEWVRVSP